MSQICITITHSLIIILMIERKLTKFDGTITHSSINQKLQNFHQMIVWMNQIRSKNHTFINLSGTRKTYQNSKYDCRERKFENTEHSWEINLANKRLPDLIRNHLEPQIDDSVLVSSHHPPQGGPPLRVLLQQIKPILLPGTIVGRKGSFPPSRRTGGRQGWGERTTIAAQSRCERGCETAVGRTSAPRPTTRGGCWRWCGGIASVRRWRVSSHWRGRVGIGNVEFWAQDDWLVARRSASLVEVIHVGGHWPGFATKTRKKLFKV